MPEPPIDAPQSTESAQPLEYWSRLSAQAEMSGNYLGACDAALIGLEQHPGTRELQYRAILNLSRAGANKRAKELWQRFHLKPDLGTAPTNDRLEENIAALGARLDREEAYAADAAQRPAKLKQAAEHYESVYRRTGSPFLGINAAVLNELGGESARAKAIVTQIVDTCAKAEPDSDEEAYHLAADRAAASLLLDDLHGAGQAIEQAAALSTNAALIASTRKQLLQICDHKRVDHAIVAPLRNRTVIYYSGHMIAPPGAPGRFPAHAETHIAEQIRATLARHDVGYGYGSLACGADTLFAEALLARKAEVDVVLPFAKDSFVKESVVNGGANWLDRFETCLGRVRLMQAIEGEHVGDTEVFVYASRLGMGLALLRAQQLSSEPIGVAVWDGRKTTDRAGTFPNIAEWQSRGLKMITIKSESNLTANPARAGSGDPRAPPRQLRAIMFGDFRNFSRLSDRQMLLFYEHVLPVVAGVLDRHGDAVVTRNTWGDGLFVVFSDIGAAARCALAIQAALANLDLPAVGLPPTLGLRLGLDAGAVFEVRDPILKLVSYTGSHIGRTARLEPTTPPGEVYVTEPFAALFALEQNNELICEYVGMMQAAKNYGRLRTYLLRRRSLSDVRALS